MNLNPEEESKKNEIGNKNYSNDLTRTFQYTRILLSVLGIWPVIKKNSKNSDICLSIFLITICLILLAFNCIPCTLHLIFIEKNPSIKLKLLGPTGFGISNLLKYCGIIYRRKMIKECVEHIEVDRKTIESKDDREIMIRNENLGRKMTIFSAMFMYIGGLSYHSVLPLWRGNSLNALNETIRPLVYLGYEIFVDPQKSPNYEIIFYTNCIAACVAYTTSTAACNSAAVFVAHACGQIEIMMTRLKTIFDETDETSGTVKKRLDFVIKSHVRVLSLATMIDTTLREICLVEVVASAVILCLLEYDFLTGWNDSDNVAIITYIVLLVSFTFNIFIFCHIGEILKDQCYEIGNVAYMMDWYRLPGKTGLALVMIIAIANRPRKLTAGGMIELSILSFGAVIKTSAAYFNMIRTMNE